MGTRSPIDRTAGAHEVRAAGGVVWRRAIGADGGADAIEVVVVHRPRYDDWTFPKGKLEKDESFEDAAWREVAEETGLVCELGDELRSVEYLDDRRRSKIVRYWTMTVRSGEFEPNDEVDRLEWLPPSDAARRLTYEHDAGVLVEFLAGLGD